MRANTDRPDALQITGDIFPRELVGEAVVIVTDPQPVMDRLVTVRFLDPEGVYEKTGGAWGRRAIRLPFRCLRVPPRDTVTRPGEVPRLS